MPPRPWLPLALLLIGCGQAAEEASAPMTPEQPAVQKEEKGVFRDLAYGTDPSQVLDLYVPDKGPTRLLVFVHGGAWQGGSRHEFDAVCRRLQKEGRAVATVDYRLSPAVRHPAHAEDVAHALAWLRAHAKEHNIIPSEIVAIGHSAGAHILATIATDPKLFALAQPAGFVGLEGIYDVPQLAKRWPKYPDWFLKKAFGPDPKGWPTLGKLATKAPWLLVHSKGDELVDMGQTDAFAAHLRKEGALGVEVVRPDGKTHDGVVQGLAAQDDEVTKAILTFAG